MIEPQAGWVDAELAEEFPELGLDLATLEVRPGRTVQSVRIRLRALSNRFTGGHVVHMRQDAVPWAYRVFFRQVGIDPDTDRTPVERLAVERLEKGGFVPTNSVDDALTIATIETGVPVIALDADRIGEAVGLRLALPGEHLTEVRPLSSRQIVVADEDRALAVLFGEISEQRGVTPETERIALCAVSVKGVPRICVEEALWTAAEALTAER